MEDITKEEWDRRLKNVISAANQGDPKAMRIAAELLFNGRTFDQQNYEDALPYYQMAADCGDDKAAEKAGICCLNIFLTKGTFMPEMFKYFKQAAAAGSPVAYRYIGMCCENGWGCDQNIAKAEEYLTTAAIKNDTAAQMELFDLIMSTRSGIDTDEERVNDLVITARASHWLYCAYVNGDKDAANILGSMIDSPAVQKSIAAIRKYGPDPAKSFGKNASEESIGEGTRTSANGDSGGCYVATAVYGSYDCPPVWTLRRFRDQSLAASAAGRAFIRTYYAVSPTLVRLFGETGWFRALCKAPLDRLVRRLNEKGVEATPYEDPCRKKRKEGSDA